MDLSLEEDATLVMLVARGDAPALEELYKRYSHSVYGMAFSLLRDQSTAEDVSQEVVGSTRSVEYSGIGSCIWRTTGSSMRFASGSAFRCTVRTRPLRMSSISWSPRRIRLIKRSLR